MMADFPPTNVKEDSAYFSVEQENPAMRSKMEGGYVLSRPRFTRAPRKKFTTGFTDITDEQKLAIESFYDSVRGGSNAFTYNHPTENYDYLVRFGEGELKFVYVGMGQTRRWNCGPITLEQV